MSSRTKASAKVKPVKACEYCFEKKCICNWYQCALCKKRINSQGTYEYRGFHSCEECFEALQERVERKRKEVSEVTAHSIKSQANGEWMNGGYKTMKTDPHTGAPIPSSLKIPQILSDYEKGIL